MAKDPNKMPLADLEKLVARRKAEAAKKLPQIRKAIEKYTLSKYGVPLADVMIGAKATKRPAAKGTMYKKPETGELYSYTRGRVPTWLKGRNGKPNQKYLHKAK